MNEKKLNGWNNNLTPFEGVGGKPGYHEKLPTMTTIEGNRLIAEFMGINNQPEYLPIYGYHSSYEWIMPVVEKIETRGHLFEISGDGCTWVDTTGKCRFEIAKVGCKLECIYKCVLEFIQWYNQNNQP